MGLDGGLNTFGYVANSPLKYTDPTELCIEDACIVENAAVKIQIWRNRLQNLKNKHKRECTNK